MKYKVWIMVMVLMAVTLVPAFASETSAGVEELLNLGTHQVEVKLSGNMESDHVLIFANGAGVDYTYWNKVTEAFAKDYKILQYNRSGQGKSTKYTYPNTAVRQYLELVQILGRLDLLEDKKTMVGHSFGGHLTRFTAATGLVEAVVLLDISNEYQFAETKEPNSEGMISLYAYVPENIFKMAISELGNEISYEDFMTNGRQVAGAAPFMKDTRAVMVSATNHGPIEGFEEQWAAYQKNMISKFHPDSDHVIAEGVGHNIPVLAPEVAIEAIENALGIDQ